ncbi:hypothetical protein Q1695_003861 [Nippostrongylus brasiliensis]|nr:hypothetical protein Q1695_003861 [Nippostrongylus brasiliensis]
MKIMLRTMVMVALLATVVTADDVNPEVIKKLTAVVTDCYTETEAVNTCMDKCIEKHPLQNARYECGVANCLELLRISIKCMKDRGFDMFR